jgi:hypothetical protein
MKKNKVAILIISVLIVALAVSVWQNISHNRRNDSARIYMLTHIFDSLMDASRELDTLIPSLENDAESDELIRWSIMNISNSLIRAHTLLTQYRFTATMGLRYGVHPYDFQFISTTLGYGHGFVNDVAWNGRWDGLLFDSVISENEISYLTALREDIAIVISEMEFGELPVNANENLTITQLNNILSTFFQKWTFNNENSPLFLLARE